MLSSLKPEFKMHGKGQGDVEFDFWSASETQYYSDRGGSEVGFQPQFEEGFVDYSPTLWETDMSRNVGNESFPLLPHSHRYSNTSPRSRLQVLAEGRRKLMEMVQSMPESSYELSLKDIVVEQQISEEPQEEMAMQRTSSDFKTEAQITKKQKTKKTKSFSKPGNISRSGSMEKETFLIKMFIPTSLSFKIRSGNTRNDSKVSPRSSMELTDNRANKECWIKRILSTEKGKKSRRTSSNSSRSTSSSSSSPSSSSSSSRSRYDDMDALPSCWPFFRTEKSKRTRRKGRIF